jgi:hypothetical protein
MGPFTGMHVSMKHHLTLFRGALMFPEPYLLEANVRYAIVAKITSPGGHSRSVYIHTHYTYMHIKSTAISFGLTF